MDENLKTRILVVDDEISITKLAVDILKDRTDYQVFSSFSGKEALEIVKKINFDLILLDIMMPEINGFEVCRIMKEDETLCSIPVIFLTGLSDDENIVKGFEAGGVDYITKPFSPQELKARINTHVKLKKYYDNEIKLREQMLLDIQRIDAVGTLASCAVHDFNNALGIILRIVDLINNEMESLSPDLAALKDNVSTINEACYQAAEIVKQILRIAKNKPPENAAADLNQLINNLSSMLKITLGKLIRINLNVLPEPAMVLCNSTQIEQVILNLCINAKHAMTIMHESMLDWGGILILTLSDSGSHGSGDKEYWVISVKDTGAGIPEDKLSKIFDPFYTTKKEGLGNGLGLLVSRQIVENHGGFIQADSVYGEGTEFRIFLPKHT